MGCLILDFDSTLVPCESLELVLARARALSPAESAEIERITREGMAGRLTFRASLEQRLAVARPRCQDVLEVGDDLAGRVTDGAAEVVVATQAAGHRVVIVSGAFRDAALQAAGRIGIPPEDVYAVCPRWLDEGAFAGFDDGDLFATSKVAGVRAIDPPLPRPAVVVGDGATDADLRDAGLADRFVAYTEHVRRAPVVARADATVENMAALGALLDSLFV